MQEETQDGLGRSPAGGNGRPHQYSHLENAMDGGAPQVTVHGAPKESDATEHQRAGHAQQADPAAPVPVRAGPPLRERAPAQTHG